MSAFLMAEWVSMVEGFTDVDEVSWQQICAESGDTSALKDRRRRLASAWPWAEVTGLPASLSSCEALVKGESCWTMYGRLVERLREGVKYQMLEYRRVPDEEALSPAPTEVLAAA